MGFCHHIAGVECDNCRPRPATIVPQIPQLPPKPWPGIASPVPADPIMPPREFGTVYVRVVGREVFEAAIDLLVAIGVQPDGPIKDAAQRLRDALAKQTEAR